MVRKHQKSIGNYIMWILLAVGLILLTVMALAIYNTTSDLLMARNNSAKVSAVNVVQTERLKLQKQSEHVLKKVAGYPEISGGKYDEKIIKSQLDRAKDAYQYIQTVTVGYSDDKYVSTQPEPADYKVTSRPWYTKAAANEGQVCWTSPYKSAATGKYLVTASYAMRSPQGKLIVVSVDLTYSRHYKDHQRDFASAFLECFNGSCQRRRSRQRLLSRCGRNSQACRIKRGFDEGNRRHYRQHQESVDGNGR